MYQEGQIAIAKCKKCDEEFPVFTFVADTDMLTLGCVALTGPGNKIVIAKRSADEENSEIEARIGGGYKIVQVRYIDKGPSAKGISFREFRKIYQPPVPIYSCINCGSDSDVIRVS